MTHIYLLEDVTEGGKPKAFKELNNAVDSIKLSYSNLKTEISLGASGLSDVVQVEVKIIEKPQQPKWQRFKITKIEYFECANHL